MQEIPAAAPRPRPRAKMEPVMTPTEAPIADTTRPKKNFFQKYLAIILIALVIVLASATTYFYKKSRSDADNSAAETKSLVAKVSKLAVVPEGETPTIATVSDPDALNGQAFFAGAKKGDKVLIYSAARKAILYDPVANKIINIAPLNVDTEKASGTQ